MTETRRPILVYVTEAERLELQAKADENGRSLSGEGRQAIRLYLSRATRTTVAGEPTHRA